MSVNQISQNKRETSQHPWHVPYSPECICVGCHGKPYFDGEIYFSCCLKCLEQKSLGPFRKKHFKENSYSTLFWLTDYERNNSGKETLHETKI